MAILDAQTLDMNGNNSTIIAGSGSFDGVTFSFGATGVSTLQPDDQHGSGVTRHRIKFTDAETTARNFGINFRGLNTDLPNYNGDGAGVAYNGYHVQIQIDTDDLTGFLRIHRVDLGVKTQLHTSNPFPAYSDSDEYWFEHWRASNGDFYIRIWINGALHHEEVDPAATALTVDEMGGYTNLAATNAGTLKIESSSWELVELQINNVGGYNSTVTTFTVDSTSGVERGDVYLADDGEYFWVAKVVDATTVIVRRGHRKSTAASVADNEVLTKVPATSVTLADMDTSSDWTVTKKTGVTEDFASISGEISASSTVTFWRATFHRIIEQVAATREEVSLKLEVKNDGASPDSSDDFYVGLSFDDPSSGNPLVAPIIDDAYYLIGEPTLGGQDINSTANAAGVANTEFDQPSPVRRWNGYTNNWSEVCVSFTWADDKVQLTMAMDDCTRDDAGFYEYLTTIHDGACFPFFGFSAKQTAQTWRARNLQISVWDAGGGGGKPQMQNMLTKILCTPALPCRR